MKTKCKAKQTTIKIENKYSERAEIYYAYRYGLYKIKI